MKKITVFLLLAVAALCSLQLSAKDGADIPPSLRSGAYTSIPDYFIRLGEESNMYYNIRERRLAGPEQQYAVSLIGKIGNRFFSSTFGDTRYDDGYGSGFLAALQVGNNTPVYVNSLNGTSNNDVNMTTTVEGHGDNAARIVYTLTNTTNGPLTVQVGVYADIMIGSDDDADLSCLKHNEDVYGLKLKGERQYNIDPIMSVLFGEGVSDVTPVDDYWFGFFSSNWHANEIVGSYSSTIYNTSTQSYSSYYSYYYMQENMGYDSGMGFCWKNKEIPAGESIELAFIIAIGEVDYEEPITPGQDVFTYNVEAYNIGDETIDGPWNDLTVAHPAHVWGYYEHPYGQNGYIEYRVDGANREWTGEWTRIPNELVSGEEFDLPFDMYFNPDEDEIHTLELRFTDGLGNYTPMDGLQWEDIRTISLTASPQVQAYDGTPKTFVVTVGGVDEYNITYTEPGEYSEAIWGIYEYETIGINRVVFTIDKGQAVIDVETPGNVEYDGNPHGVIVNVITGDGQYDVTYYMVDEQGVAHEINGVPVQQGVYYAVVTVPETNYYYGTQGISGAYEIYIPTGVEELTIGTEDNGAWYTIDGRRIVAPTQPGLYIHNGKKYIVK